METNNCNMNEDQSAQSSTLSSQVINSKVKIKNISDLNHIQCTDNTNNNPNVSKQNRQPSVPGKPRGATYDGNMCMVCSDRASGFHYGVLACEGCKGFFKRVCKEKLNKSDSDLTDDVAANSKRHCIFGGNCEINVRTRNRCQYCRIQKCIELGMSKDGIKLGRRSKKFKQNLNSTASNQTNTKITNNSTEIDNNNNNNNQNKTLTDASPVQPTTSSYSNINNNELVKLKTQTVIQSNPQPTPPQQQQQQQQQTPIIAIIQDHNIIFKAIDILTAAASVSASSSTSPSTMNNDQLVINSSTNNSNETVTQTPKTNIINGNFINLMIQQQQNQQQQQSPIQTNNLIVLNNLPQSDSSASSLSSSSKMDSLEQLNTSFYYSMLDTNQLKNIIEAILQAHKETNMFTQSKLDSIDLTSLNHTKNHQMRHLFDSGLLSLLNETKFLDHFNNLIENAVLFAKNVPYFMNVHETDRISLLKSCVFEIICVRHAVFYRSSDEDESRSTADLATLAACAVASAASSQFNSLVTTTSMLNTTTTTTTSSSKLSDFFLLNDTWTSCEYLCDKLPQLKGFILMLMEFYRFYSSMNLDENETALFCSYLLFNTVDQKLNDSEKLTNYRGLFNNILVNELEKKRSLIKKTDHESANKRKKYSSHSSIQVWLNNCCKKLKDLNNEHAKVLLEYKQFIQFPDLYSELYNL